MADTAAPTPEAVQACRDDIAENPANAPLRFELGQMLRAIGDLAGAADEFEAALALKPNYSRASKALDECKNRAPSDPPDPTSKYGLTNVHSGGRNWQRIENTKICK